MVLIEDLFPNGDYPSDIWALTSDKFNPSLTHLEFQGESITIIREAEAGFKADNPRDTTRGIKAPSLAEVIVKAALIFDSCDFCGQDIGYESLQQVDQFGDFLCARCYSREIGD